MPLLQSPAQLNESQQTCKSFKTDSCDLLNIFRLVPVSLTYTHSSKSIKGRSAELLKKFTKAKLNHDLISSELEDFKNEILQRDRKFVTVFDKMLKIISG